MSKQYETVIGLEVHVELATKTKIFCSCSTAFGGAPNTHTCPVCTGMPGSLPVLNKQVVEYALAVGLAANWRKGKRQCESMKSIWKRMRGSSSTMNGRTVLWWITTGAACR